MERKTERRRGQSLSTPEARARWRRKHTLKRYGLTQERFDAMLAAQGYRCAMCPAPFEEGQPVYIDHDHNLGCHPGEKQACDACRRGLLCLTCNTALGYVERYGALSRAYLEGARHSARPGTLFIVEGG